MVSKTELSELILEPVRADAVLAYASSEAAARRTIELQKGQIPWDKALNLKGFKTNAVRDTLYQFIQNHAQKKETCILIQHGTESAHGTPPLVKNLVNQWLRQFKEVIAFHSALPKDGGVGAVYVLLQKTTVIEIPAPPKRGSYLIAETKSMERKRRLAEQQGERQLAPVKAREHSDKEPSASPEGELQNSILQHPELNSQRFDGIDPNLNPEPPLNTDARREFDNERREQEMEKQLRLGNMPKFTSTPTPRGP